MLNRQLIVKRYGIMPGLVEISLPNSHLSAIDLTDEADFFTEHKDTLELIDLSSNLFELVEVNIFKGLNRLKEVNLGNNNLAYLNSELFKDTVQLETLFLNLNKLGSLEPKFFANCSHLTQLDLSYNQLSSVNEKLFESCANLVNLRLDKNNIVYVHPNAFEKLSKLTVLRLKKNSIKHLDKQLFRNCTSLKELNLNDNNLVDVSPQLLSPLVVLTKLDLSNNDFTSLDITTLAACEKLEEIGLLNARLDSLPVELFTSCKESIRQIWLDSNKIPLVDKGAFESAGLFGHLIFWDFEAKNLVKFNSEDDLVPADHHGADYLSSTHSPHNMTLNSSNNKKERQTENLLFESENYETKELIGFGRLSTVYRVVDKKDSNEKVIKRYSSRCLDSITGKSMLKEVKMLTQLDNEFILKCHGYFHQPASFCVIMEFFPGKQPLEDLLNEQRRKKRNFSMKQIFDWMRHTISAIDYLHNEESIIHLNCNPKSFFVDENKKIKLGEFSKAVKSSGEHESWNFDENPSYLCPEIIENRGCTFKSDIWAVGCIIFELIDLKKPFRGKTFYEICQSIANDHPELKRKDLGVSLKSLIKLMMEKEPSKRINSIELVEKFSDISAERQPSPKRREDFGDSPDPDDDLAKSLGISREEFELSMALEKRLRPSRKSESNFLINFTARPKFQTIDRLGSGSFGVVYLVLDHDDQKLKAVKKLFPASHFSSPVLPLVSDNELELLKKLDCPFIVKYLDDFAQNDSVCIVMEYCEKKDLDVLISQQAKTGKKFRISRVYQWILQILTAIEYLHSKSIIHRDVKPRNIFVNASRNLKLGDLGTAMMIDSIPRSLHDTVGTWYYVSPQIILGTGYLYKTDVWSTGCVIFELINLKKAFEGLNLYQLMSAITEKELRISEDPGFHGFPLLAPLVESMLQKDQSKRCCSKDALDRFKAIYDLVIEDQK